MKSAEKNYCKEWNKKCVKIKSYKTCKSTHDTWGFKSRPNEILNLNATYFSIFNEKVKEKSGIA